MNYCGFDAGKKSSHFCILDEGRTILKEGPVRNRLQDLRRVFGKLAKMRIVIEASGKGFWLADQLEMLGHDVVVCDPGQTKAIGAARIKHDRLDARVLAELCKADLLTKVDRPSQAERVRRMTLVVRRTLVRNRVRLINTVRSLADGEGVILRPCAAARFTSVARGSDDQLPMGLGLTIDPLLTAIDGLTVQIEDATKRLEEAANKDPVVGLLKTCPGVGTQTAAAFAWTIRDPRRFRSGRQVAAYLGLVPSLYASGQTHRRGNITKRGDRNARWLLTMAANAVMNRYRGGSPLRLWALRLSERIGKKKAIVALARKLATVLWAMWRDGRTFEVKAPAA